MQDTVAAYAVLPDIDGNNAILIRSTLPNNVVSYKNEFLLKGGIVFLMEGAFFLIALTAVINWRDTRCRPRVIQTAESMPTSDAALFEHIAGAQNTDKNTSPVDTRNS
jgi:hypothetical protein